jgi:hypothetical protein
MNEGALVFIETKEQLRLFLYMRESVVGEDVASGARIFRVPRPLILYRWHDIGEAPGARSSLMSCVVSLKSRLLSR